MKPKSERKKRYHAKIHQKGKYLNVHLSKELKEKTKKRSLVVKKGDKVKIMRGSYKNKDATVARVDYKNCKVYLEGISRRTARGREMIVAFEPSNLRLTTISERKAKSKNVQDKPRSDLDGQKRTK